MLLNLISTKKKHRKFGYELIEEIRTRFADILSPKEWNIMIRFERMHGDINGIDGIKQMYDEMVSNGVRLSRFTFHNLLCCSIDRDPEYAQILWNDIIAHHDQNEHEMKQIFDFRTLRTLMLCIDKMTENDKKYEFLCSVWSALENMNFYDLYCFCLAMFMLSKHPKNGFCEKVEEMLSILLNDEEMRDALRESQHSNEFRFVLMSYSNQRLLDEMWSFYKSIGCKYYHFVILMQIVSGMDMERKLLMMRQHMMMDDELVNDTNLIKHFHRTSIECKDERMQNDLWRIMRDRHSECVHVNVNVMARFTLKGKEHSIGTGYKGDDFKSMQKVQGMIKKMKYKINTLYAAELKDEESRETHLQSHAEKKALAVLLHHQCDQEPITVRVSMRMCGDCIGFFQAVSRHYNKKLLCIDTKCQHTFEDGKHFKC